MKLGLFPGQGIPAQVVFEGLSSQDDLLAAAGDVLGFDLRKRVQIATRRKGAALPTLVAQPAILVAGVLAWRRARNEGRRWDCFAGHSLGEYTALVAAGALEPAGALAAVKVRAEGMEEASKASPGGMAAVLGLDLERVSDIAEQAGVVVANDNAPGQVVLSGREEGLAQAAEMVRAAGARSVLLEVAGPFHTPAMGAAATGLREALDRIDIAPAQGTALNDAIAAGIRELASTAPTTLSVTRSCSSKMSLVSPSNRSAQTWCPVVPSMSWPVMRTREPAFRMLPSRT